MEALDEWPVVDFARVMGTFSNMEKQIEILRSRIKNQDKLILDLKNQPLAHNIVEAPVPIVKDYTEVNEKMLAMIQALTIRCNQSESFADEQAKKFKALEKKIEDLTESESSRLKETGLLKDRITSLESKLHDFQMNHRTQMLALDQTNIENLNRLQKLDGLELLPAVVDSLRVELCIFKEETEKSIQEISADVSKQDERARKMTEGLELHGLKIETVETDVVKVTRVSKSLREEISTAKEAIERDALLLAELGERKADKDDLFRKADKSQLVSKAENTEIERIDDNLSSITRRLTHTETNVYQGLESANKTTEKKLEDLTFSMIRVIKKEVKRVLAQAEGAADVGQAAGSRNRCLMCDQVVKPMVRESPAQLPELPHTQGPLHVHRQQGQQGLTTQQSTGKQRDKSPPHVFLDKKGKEGDSSAQHVVSETEESVGIVIRSNEKTQVVIKDIAGMTIHGDEKKPQIKKNLAFVRPQEKTGILNKGLVYDATNGELVANQRDFVVNLSSSTLTGRQVGISEHFR
jgi:hypothetical protein